MQFGELSRPQSALRDAITAAYRRDERECVQAILAQAALSAEQVKSIQALARKLVTDVREKRTRSSGVDALMHEFSLDSTEGVALMCLAEALLRIPDQETADRLIRDKISKGDWKAHLGQSASLFVNAATWGLLITGKLVSTNSEKGLSSALTRMIAKGGEPLIRKGVDLAMRMLGKQFVTGETIDEALSNGVEREARGFRFSYDMLGEAAMTDEDAQRYYTAYEQAIHAIGKASKGRGVYAGPGISVKLSALHPRYSRAQHARAAHELLPRIKSLLLLAKQYDIGFNVDAEEADRLELSLDLLEALALDPAFAGWNGIGFVVQAYQKRCPFVIDWIIDLARRSGHRFMVRLVKGAYWDAEIKRAQLDGLEGYPVYTRKVYTDVAYLACAKKLLAAQDAVFPQFATHNAYSLAAIHQLGEGKDYEFQCLHGMGETLYDLVVGQDKLGKACRIYAPVGSHETLLAYLVRRLLENGANTSFVNRIVDEAVPIDELIADQVTEAAKHAGQPHGKIPLPSGLYGESRPNSDGMDLSNEFKLSGLSVALRASESRPWQAAPILGSGLALGGTPQPIHNPANRDDIVGHVVDASPEQVSQALDMAAAAAPRWAAVPAADRAACIARAGDLLQQQMSTLMGLAVREAGKSLPNAIAEVREAIDFCRYYATQARQELSQATPRGPMVCISPWNFPLAIFIGQVTAALAAGNPVLAKPAEQTPLIAAEAVRLLHEAGIPQDVLQFLPGTGEIVGAALTRDPRIAGVMFTGSTEVAQLINRTLAARDDSPLLIAETGGMNAMIVDSSALPEQVVNDVLSSAFDSAGQRCSALRVLYLQRDIADKVITMLKGAMQELRIGNPALLETDIGPVIDQEAQRNLQAHIEKTKLQSKWHYQAPLGKACEQGTFVAPTLFEIDNIRQLEREVFGPVLHIVRFDGSALDQVIADINATGYGLTHGVHSRIDETIDQITQQVHSGNIYVNRNIVGAVVGVQPFGGEGKSGTGPKAGGPLYLHRLTHTTAQPQIGKPARVVELTGLKRLAEARLSSLSQGQRDQLQAIIFEYEAASPLRREALLNGPTGERNSLGFAPRGRVACLAEGLNNLALQAAAALACGNHIVLPSSSDGRALAEALGDVASTSQAPEAEGAILAVLHDGDHASALALQRTLAKRDGALIPMIRPDHEGRYDLYRLVAERAISVNTTAAGGNASLMSIGE
ncbi:RHH-type proline utilization regulon transcriptional repressor/proline dehydrogenase/delta 1-pyrroline-5-carboxylate dehydrogenase [Chitinivorax tropicus]|uniref:Bifunctional protein PutA n=1 Tax=Chitinivorax tropicus TaxID=714531 RepID=A0A840MSM9_9PROT|nr:trifunctional transcriptional regulator/proline dehydrogenase/L-glutamate gamma-semialdehyde dehydrogenase [Chitinivorax tropicus]MBB5019772.1 RHH-type proline utilization regulon transcriptional repressor/proline dehydrogenase/delta 1-pyrroline-5-carboxylate dehydrogenase [Chitinivorax tropicus]